MKTVKMFNTKKIVATLAVVALTITSVTAQPVNKSAKALPGEPLSVKYLGADDDYLVFEISITSNSNHSVFHIDDANAGSLYAETVKGYSKVETIKIEKKDNQNLNFELVAGKKTYSKSFAVNTKVVEKTTVLESSISSRY